MGGRVAGEGFVAGYFMMGPTLKLSFNDFWSFYARPINLEVAFNGDGAGFGGLFSVGAGITF